jgi:hypothetical protein
MVEPTTYLNFDLEIMRSGERYRAHVRHAPGGDADIFFDLPPSLPSFQALLQFNGARRGVREGAAGSAPAASLDKVGSLLYETIFQSTMRDVLIASQREAENAGAGLNLHIGFMPDAADLAILPWEILYDASQARFLALSEQQPIVRYLSLPRPLHGDTAKIYSSGIYVTDPVFKGSDEGDRTARCEIESNTRTTLHPANTTSASVICPRSGSKRSSRGSVVFASGKRIRKR